MGDHPIIFSAQMIRALLDGRKTMTRRLAWRDAPSADGSGRDGWRRKRGTNAMGWERPSPWQRVQPGDRLWVREKFHLGAQCTHYAEEFDGTVRVTFRSPIHMPRWASRLTLVVTAVKIERLQEISEADARAEGVLYVPGHGDITPTDLRADPGYSNFLNCRMGFAAIWQELHGRDSWGANPEVVALSFIVQHSNIDAKEPTDG